MAEATIRTTCDPDTDHRSQSIQVNGKSVKTPVKAIDYNKVLPSLDLRDRGGYIHELYQSISKSMLSDHARGKKTGADRVLDSYVGMFKDPSVIQMCFLKYSGEGFPKPSEIEYLTDLAYGYSDITPIPMISDFLGKITSTNNKNPKTSSDKKFEIGKRYILDAIETIKQRHHKPIMGYIPNSRNHIDELVKLYHDAGINMFYFDANRTNPVNAEHNIRKLTRNLKNHRTFDKSFIYIVNAGYGRAEKNGMIPAMDILGFGLGIDCLGENHAPAMRPRNLIAKMMTDVRFPKIFLKDHYAYYKFNGKDGVHLYPQDSSVDIKEFMVEDRTGSKTEKTFNVEQLVFESELLGNTIRSSVPMLEYLKDKPLVRKYVKQLMRDKNQHLDEYI